MSKSSLENPVNMRTSVDEVLAQAECRSADGATIPRAPTGARRIGPAFWTPSRPSSDRCSRREAGLTAGSAATRLRCRPRNSAAINCSSRSAAAPAIRASMSAAICSSGRGFFVRSCAAKPEIVRVPSLRNVATTAPYFHDGSAPTLEEAVRRMAAAQLDRTLSDQQVDASSPSCRR